MEEKVLGEDTQSWKGTGQTREMVRAAWESIPAESRPTWNLFVKNRREVYEREQRRVEFDSVLTGKVGVRVTIPSVFLAEWEKVSEIIPLVKEPSSRTGHDCMYYLLSEEEKGRLHGILGAFRDRLAVAV